MSTSTTSPEISGRKLMISTVGAALVALVILVIAVLPAEFGRDPTGLGQALGLTALSQASDGPADLVPDGRSGTSGADMPSVVAEAAAYATEQRTLTLAPGEGVEIKALMAQGQSFVFSWNASEPVHFDMHGEPPGDADDFESYWRERSRSASSGLLIAPFDGTHGWYWKNPNSGPVTINVQLSGFFEKVYRP